MAWPEPRPYMSGLNPHHQDGSLGSYRSVPVSPTNKGPDLKDLFFAFVWDNRAPGPSTSLRSTALRTSPQDTKASVQLTRPNVGLLWAERKDSFLIERLSPTATSAILELFLCQFLSYYTCQAQRCLRKGEPLLRARADHRALRCDVNASQLEHSR